ncbi:inactive protein RESTRICTED TEV MOVEMENT 2-like [Lycium barbarum]|uniref:inactive protein RESTRICTED TEV MOVEMENT 2-like n=1 Tax=Lycium barbarum TaxID=112863 RepID=UPI00293E90DC|nr:inactive protein RESTRICTED TEV MOVEMENT 2-like [Lycium barbarum]
MDSKGAAAAVPTQVYEDFVPTTELVQEQDSDTLLLNLTGFKKEQVRVQLTRTGILKISGQRPVVGQNKSLRFQKDFPVSENCDKTKISAKFENGILYVKQPKLITSSDKNDQATPTTNPQQPKKPADEPQPQKKDEEQATTTTTTTKELPKQQANADKPEIEEPNTKEAKDLQEKLPAEKTATNSTAQDRNRQNYESKLENDANMGGIAALAEKLKMPRKVMNMSLIALLVLGIGLYVSHMMKSAITKFTN